MSSTSRTSEAYVCLRPVSRSVSAPATSASICSTSTSSGSIGALRGRVDRYVRRNVEQAHVLGYLGVHIEGEELLQPVVLGLFVSRVDGDADKVAALQHGKRLEVEVDVALARDGAKVEALQPGVGAVGGVPAVVVDRETEHRVVDWLVGAVGHADVHAVAGVEVVDRGALVVQQRDPQN